MVSETFLFLCLIAVCVCDDLDNGTLTTSIPKDTTLDPSSPLFCTTKEGKSGECTPYYLCNTGNTEQGFIDIAGSFDDAGSPCGVYDVCCLKPDSLETTSSPQVSETFLFVSDDLENGTLTTSRPEDTTLAPSSPLFCTTKEGKSGECTPYYLCNTANTEQGFIDIAGSFDDAGSPCGVYDVCCLKPDSLETTSSPRVSETFLFVSDDLENRTLTTSSPEDTTLAPSSPLFCTTKEGKSGECTPYYLCNTANTEQGFIDIAGSFDDAGSPCSVYDVCCLKPDSLETTSSPQKVGCGWRNPLGIMKDEEGVAKFAEFPWICAVLKTEPVNDDEPEGQKIDVYIGGGSLIHPSVVLTAAHVVSRGNSSAHLLVRAGEWDTQRTNEPLPHQSREVASAMVHEDYKKNTLFYDIALLFLSKPMDLAPNVALACLPPPREHLPSGTRCTATGWGKDKFGKEGRYQVILKKVEVPSVEHATCQKKLRSTRLGQLFMLHTSFMCAGGELDKDVCTGDGGSPLSCPIKFEDGRYMQSGIVAWSIGCGKDGVPGVYVDVSNLRSWIDDKVAGKGYDPKVYSF